MTKLLPNPACCSLVGSWWLRGWGLGAEGSRERPAVLLPTDTAGERERQPAARVPLANRQRSTRRHCSSTSRCCRRMRYEGARPGTPGEERTVNYLTAQFQKVGLRPGNTDGTFVQKVPLVGITGAEAKPLVVGGEDRGQSSNGRMTSSRGPSTSPRGPASTSPKWCSSATASLRRSTVGRLQGRGRQGQDDRHARQRSADPGSCRSVEAGCADVQRQGDDVLRPLDLQVRRGGADAAPPASSSSTKTSPPAIRSKSSRASLASASIS